MNSSGGASVSSRQATGHSLPLSIIPQDITQVSVHVPPPPWAKTSFSFIRPLNLGGVSISSETVFIYAASNGDPQSKDDIRSVFPIHDKFGVISNVDFTIVDAHSDQANKAISLSTTTEVTSHCIYEKFCVYGRFDSSKSEITFTIHAAADGWASVGLGTRMAGNYIIYIPRKSSVCRMDEFYWRF
jgi:hypothetical protein